MHRRPDPFRIFLQHVAELYNPDSQEPHLNYANTQDQPDYPGQDEDGFLLELDRDSIVINDRTVQLAGYDDDDDDEDRAGSTIDDADMSTDF